MPAHAQYMLREADTLKTEGDMMLPAWIPSPCSGVAAQHQTICLFSRGLVLFRGYGYGSYRGSVWGYQTSVSLDFDCTGLQRLLLEAAAHHILSAGAWSPLEAMATAAMGAQLGDMGAAAAAALGPCCCTASLQQWPFQHCLASSEIMMATCMVRLRMLASQPPLLMEAPAYYGCLYTCACIPAEVSWRQRVSWSSPYLHIPAKPDASVAFRSALARASHLQQMMWRACAEYEMTCFSCCADDSVTVAKLQVGLLGDARRLQRQLDRIAGRADTNTPSGLHYILQGKCTMTPSSPCAESSGPVELRRYSWGAGVREVLGVVENEGFLDARPEPVRWC